MLERILKRDRRITIAGIVILSLLAWGYLLAGAGMAMPVNEMTTMALFPHTVTDPMSAMGQMMPPGQWTPVYTLMLVLMWWVMMIAMMVPSAAPMILLHARVARHTAVNGHEDGDVLLQSGRFVAGYLLVWFFFSLVAALLQWLLEVLGLVSAMRMWSMSGPLSAGILLAAGVYQWTPLKYTCLRHCRTPVYFLTHYWRPGPLGALRLGVLHGAYCVGCCGVLMALLLVGGVMNLLWIALLAIIVLIEKVAGEGVLISRLSGVLLVIWGLAVLWI